VTLVDSLELSFHRIAELRTTDCATVEERPFQGRVRLP